MTDQHDPGRENLGDGDLVDPDEFAGTEMPSTGSGAGSGGPTPGDPDRDPDRGLADDGDDIERASEVDDVTGSIPRIDPDAADPVDQAAMIVELEALRTERDEFKQLAQRVQADFDNFRKQSAVRAQADAERAAGRLAEALLPVLDAAEAAYLNHPDEIGPLLNQMLGELKKHGLETIDLDGQPFDPEVAEAVAHEPGGGGEATVAEVLRSGYRWKGRTLRAAMVKTTD